MPTLDPDTLAAVKARIEAMSPEEKRAMVQRVSAMVGALVFDVVAAHHVAQSHGRDMPVEADFVQAVMGDNPSQHVH